MPRYRSLVVAKLQLVRSLVNDRFVPLLRAEASALETLARTTLPDNRREFRSGLQRLTVRLWGSVGDLTVAGVTDMFRLADREIGGYTLDVIAARTDLNGRPDLLASELGQVIERARKHAVQARHGRTLSDRVWANGVATRRRINREVDLAIAKGESPAKLARRLRQYVNPGTPGGVSYAAMRLARTELLAAWDARERQLLTASGLYTMANWELSPTHDAKPSSPDVCDRLSEGGPYLLAALPDRPHPHCMCWLDPILD